MVKTYYSREQLELFVYKNANEETSYYVPEGIRKVLYESDLLLVNDESRHKIVIVYKQCIQNNYYSIKGQDELIK